MATAMNMTAVPGVEPRSSESSERSWLRKLLSACIRSKQISANREICRILSTKDKHTLISMGFTIDEIERLKSGRVVPLPFQV